MQKTLQHEWIALKAIPVILFQRTSTGEIRAIVDKDAKAETHIGCLNCDATPEEGWGTPCNGTA